MEKKTGGKQDKKKPKQEKERNPDGTFPKGKSGNPNGRPREKSLTTLLKEALKQIEKATGEQYDVLLVKRLLEKAISKGDMKAIQMIWERLEGKPKQSIELGGIDGDPIEYNVRMTKLREQVTRMNEEWFVVDEEEEEKDEDTAQTKAEDSEEQGA